MTNEEAIKILEEIKARMVPLGPLLEGKSKDEEAVDMAIEALSKQSASCGQADQCGNCTEMVELKKRTITERLIIAESLIDSVIADSDQFRDITKKTEDVPDMDVGKTDFKPGDKFILELGAERKMFDEFEIADTDLYVKTSLLEKLTRYEPEENATADKILIDLAEAIETVEFECGEWEGLAKTIVNGIKKLTSAQPERKTKFVKLTVRNSNGRPYYSIIYLEDGNEFEGYSSYSLDVISDYLKRYFEFAQPEPNTGRWIDDNCSECGQYVFHGDARNFCPNCGAKMENDL